MKQFEKLYFARLANTVSRYKDALCFIQDHFTQGFERDPGDGQLRRTKVKSGVIAVKKGDGPQVIIYDTEEIETYCDIVKNYIHTEKKTLRTLK